MIDGSRAEAINAAHHAEVEQRVEQVFLVLIPFRKSPSVILEPDLERPALLISRLFLHVQIADVLGEFLIRNGISRPMTIGGSPSRINSSCRERTRTNHAEY